ncbi:MAG: helix-hairpin-helix domain-containing protein [Prevotella sp.]|nr:helix-hairpin-helix domain-containing protein [Prevotella sp.]
MNIREFFYFQKSDRKVLLFCLCLAAVAVLAFTFLGNREQKTTLGTTDTVFIERLPASSATDYQRHRYQHHRVGGYYKAEERRIELFPFDPNTADSTQLLRLGLRPWQVRNIYKYRARGGTYRQPSDFARLYGLTVKEYRRLEPYIRISSDYQPASTLVGERPTFSEKERDTVKYPVKIKPTEHVVLNVADTSMLKKVPGIGSAWARRIVSYGERLGGYTDVIQLTEIDDFPEDALQYFVVSNPNPRKLNLNQLSLNQLRRHPYINFYQARTITDYRRLKGNLQSLDQLRLLKDFPPEAIERLAPYVEF